MMSLGRAWISTFTETGKSPRPPIWLYHNDGFFLPPSRDLATRRHPGKSDLSPIQSRSTIQPGVDICSGKPFGSEGSPTSVQLLLGFFLLQVVFSFPSSTSSQGERKRLLVRSGCDDCLLPDGTWVCC
ncbi:hypothetical protein Pst134EB_016509 [Puccinia striiformis f. sp. tritici]|nr:hypothetical protein Pst134EB_016509 [Puccinia striiformis f. sp. tritici]